MEGPQREFRVVWWSKGKRKRLEWNVRGGERKQPAARTTVTVLLNQNDSRVQEEIHNKYYI